MIISAGSEYGEVFRTQLPMGIVSSSIEFSSWQCQRRTRKDRSIFHQRSKRNQTKQEESIRSRSRPKLTILNPNQTESLLLIEQEFDLPPWRKVLCKEFSADRLWD
jgi:hypothetical protein